MEDIMERIFAMYAIVALILTLMAAYMMDDEV
jgi:hypothetical protein